MLRTILSVTAGFFLAGFIAERGSVKKFGEVAREKAVRIKSAAVKAAAAAKEEYYAEAEEPAVEET